MATRCLVTASVLDLESGTAKGSRTMSYEVILVHGAWSSPADWHWVEGLLVERDTQVNALDLVSHRRGDATRADDVEQLTAAVVSASTPPIVVGWSYGGSVITDLNVAQLNISRLIYVSSVPGLPPPEEQAAPPVPDIDVSHLVFGDDGTVVLDNDWFPTSDPAAATMPVNVIDHFRSHPRRPASLQALVAPQSHTAWRHANTTVLVGASDETISDAQRQWAIETIPDTQVVDCDHFIPMRQPEIIVDAIFQA